MGSRLYTMITYTCYFAFIISSGCTYGRCHTTVGERKEQQRNVQYSIQMRGELGTQIARTTLPCNRPVSTGDLSSHVSMLLTSNL